MNEYILDVRTNKNLGEATFISVLLAAWRNDIHPNLQVEFFGLGEPIRQSFNEKGVECATETWIENGMGLMLKRKSRHKFVADIDWREEKGLDQRPFPWSCRVWLDRKAGDNLALEFFRFLIKYFEPAFGHLSTANQDRSKHFVSVESSVGSIEQYVGLDIEDKLPGIYWITYFGDWAVERIGERKFDSLSFAECEKTNSGILLRAYPSSEEIGSKTANESENLILQHLGKSHFFNKSLFDLDSLLFDSETETLINEKVKEIKSQRQ